MKSRLYEIEEFSVLDRIARTLNKMWYKLKMREILKIKAETFPDLMKCLKFENLLL